MPGAVRICTGKSLLLLAVIAVVCPLARAQFGPSDAASYGARAVTVSGQVSVLRDSVPWAVSVGDQVQVQQMIMAGPDGHALFQVSDGSTFEVFPNSMVVFRKTPFNWRDLLDVVVGRVRVHIEHLGGQPNPNRVLTPTAVISVRGTTFDVAVEDDSETTVIEVEEGQVEVQHALLPRDNPKILNPGDPPLRVYKNEPLAESPIDKGTIIRYVLHALRNAAATMASRSAKVNVPGKGPLPGDSCKPGAPGCGTAPPAPPPPPGPPPPPPLH